MMNELVNTPDYLVVYSAVVVADGYIDIDFIQRERICINTGERIRFLLLDLVLQVVHRLILVDVDWEPRAVGCARCDAP